MGYEPKTDMETGIRKTLDWISDNRDSVEASAEFWLEGRMRRAGGLG